MNRYWIEREALRYKQNLMKIGAYDRELDKLYRQAYMAVEKEIADFYARYAKDNNLTMAEARKRISAFDVKAYQDRVAEIMKRGNLSARARQELRLYNATMKINRLEMLKANIGLSLIETYQSEEDAFRECLNEDAASEYRRQSGILGEMTQDMPKEMLQSVVEGSFHNATFSDRIWAHQDELRYRLESMLTNGLIQGKNPRAYISQLRKQFGVSRSNAFRLLRTEFARVQTDTQMRMFGEYGYDEYIFISNSTACRDCLDLNGQHFKVADQRVGENAPPIHPNCMCSTAAYSRRNAVQSDNNGRIIETGGKRYIPNDPDNPRDIAAAQEYRRISRRNDIKAVAKSSGLSENDIKEIRRYIFFNKHKKYDGYGMLDPDYDMAVAWKRLSEGRPKHRDITLLRHELLESRLEKEQHLTVAEAHSRAKKEYDWEDELRRDLGDEGEPDGLL